MFALDEVQSTQNALVYQTTSKAKLQFTSCVCSCFVVKDNSEGFFFFGNITFWRDVKSPHIGFSLCVF